MGLRGTPRGKAGEDGKTAESAALTSLGSWSHLSGNNCTRHYEGERFWGPEVEYHPLSRSTML